MPISDRPPAQPIVLVIEQNRFLCDMICAWLEGTGYAVRSASDEAAALAALEHRRFDLVLLDLDLRRPEGTSLLRSVQSKLAGAPLVLLMGAAGYDDVLASVLPETPCVKLGKPYSFFTLGLVMEAALGRGRRDKPESGVRRTACE
jgi:DNA-binding response OmpR family regulator